MVQDLVHPSLYPLVWGTTALLQDEVVGVEDAIEKWAGKEGVNIADVAVVRPDRPAWFRNDSGVPRSLWSKTYQWLPANVAFQDDGSVKFTSYINNLHPTKYPDVYRTIEALIQRAIPMWNQCLVLSGSGAFRIGVGRMVSRFSIPHAE
jgi:hypothetical protein